MRIRIPELMAETGATPKEVSAILWPDAKPHTRYVLMRRFERMGYVQTGLDKLKALSEFFGTTNINKLIDETAEEVEKS
jgi:hypothetical protein